jgi:hypothetical protein
MNDTDCSPEFLESVEAYSLLEESGIDENSPELMAAWDRMIKHAPRALMMELQAKAVEFGLLPSRPDGYMENGKPVYTLQSVAQCLGISEQEARESLGEYCIATGSEVIDPANVRRVQ